MLTFNEMTEPVSGWELESLRNRRALDRNFYWDIQLINENGHVVSAQHKDLERAWDAARRIAETYDNQHAMTAYKRLQLRP